MKEYSQKFSKDPKLNSKHRSVEAKAKKSVRQMYYRCSDVDDIPVGDQLFRQVQV